MTSTTNAEIAKADGDLRIALLLGIANWFLFLDHIPHNVVGALTMRNFGFSGATDLFVFVGGYAVTLIYARMTLERGFLVAATRIFKRVWQLYAAYIVLFVIYVELISYVATRTAAPEIISEFNITGFIDHPIRTLIYGLFLQAKPLNLDVLQLTIALMAFQPIIVFGLLYVPNVTIVASVTLYAAGRLLDWNLSSYPYGDWYLNPFCWQLLFVMGGWLALIGARYAPAIRAMQAAPALRATALLYLLFALTIVSTSDIPALAQMMPSGLSDMLPPNDRRGCRASSHPALRDLDVPVHVAGAARLGIPAISRLAADHQVRRGMAGRVLCRRLPLIRCAPDPDYGPILTGKAGRGQHRRYRRDDGRRLLRLVVEAAGRQVGRRGAFLNPVI
ncbi:OpgC domain-containing protein [Bradyrhizobium elkanii]|uniref:OpgC domain-containing protein n=1 Tax=Bradyrhizobium elkanii TaxID=29448 RepID=UPI003597BBB2